jgi:arylformamidase
MAHDVDLPGRRRIFGVGAAIAASPLLFSQEARAQQAKVFMNYSQTDLDREYDQAPWAPNQDKVGARTGAKLKQALQKLGAPAIHAYGPGKNESLQLMRSKRSNAPIQIYIHGGAWRGSVASEQLYAAPKYVVAGANYIALDFSTVMDVGLDGMVDQVRRAIVWVYKNAESFGGDRSRIFISGHSSGSHLGGVMTITDWQGMYGLPPDVIKGAFLTSGMYDLYPVRLSSRDKYVHFTDAIENDFSAMRHLDKISCPIIVGYGEYDTDEFRRQTQEFAAAIAKLGKLQKVIFIPGANHWEIPEAFADPFSVIGYESLMQMGFDPFAWA